MINTFILIHFFSLSYL